MYSKFQYYCISVYATLYLTLLLSCIEIFALAQIYVLFERLA